MPLSATPDSIHLSDYRPADYLIEAVDLDFDLGAETTRVRARLDILSNHDRATKILPLVLDGEDLDLRTLSIDGEPLSEDRYEVGETVLTIFDPPVRFTLETEVEIKPGENTKLEGLYTSSGNFCTQCEAEGFRRITYYLDRPDVTATFSVRMTAEKTLYPILLSNGNPVEAGDLADGRHWARWDDPFPKPSYLFALVAGDLACVEDHFTTASGRRVTLRIFVEHGKEDRCDHAMASLKAAMRWDETRFGLEYDLDIFMIVAVSDFNMGAMENKGLNVFNDRYVLARPETATDADYAAIEAIVAHEYFHNWTGNRVTLRDWFQLSLKEGLTVFRDQEFSADMRAAAVQRISDVRTLRARQFPEDAGPLAHPVRPESYIEINNFYTATVYEKGAELVRMIQTFVGRDGFAAGLRAYLAENDGCAATVEDFIAAMEGANEIDLTQFKLWYAQAGTPKVEIETRHDAGTAICEVMVSQTTPPTPGQPEKAVLSMPLDLALFDRDGTAFPLRLDGEDGGATSARVLTLDRAQQTYRFAGIPRAPVVSAFRNFSAPVGLSSSADLDDRTVLLAHDDDLFNRWEAGQQSAAEILLDIVAGGEPGEAELKYIDALGAMLRDRSLDRAFLAEAMVLPSEEYLGNLMDRVDVEGIHAARDGLRRRIAHGKGTALRALYDENLVNRPYEPTPEEAARRKLKNGALAYLVASGDGAARELCMGQFRGADNMTDSVAALSLLAQVDCAERDEALAAFHERWRDDPLVLDKWFAIQATSSLPETLSNVVALLDHRAFNPRNPNKVRALIGAFCAGNQLRFHAADGAGYGFMADQVLNLDAINPQIAARLLAPLGQWRHFDPARQKLMRGELQRVLAKQNLSRDVYEIASKSLE